MDSRRTFLKKIGLAGAGLAMQPLSGLLAQTSSAFWKSKGIDRLIILHTNDMHSHIEPFPANDPKYANQGGMAMRGALIRKIREEGDPVILLDCGDIFQGTPYFNLYGGEPEFRMMSEMGYDAATFGNHDFDNGVEGLISMMPHARFPFINANYQTRDSVLKKAYIPSKVFKKGPFRIGVTGLGVSFEGLVAPKNHEGLTYTDPVAALNREAMRLKQDEKCDIVICLSHLGFSYNENKISDITLATESKNVDIILGGHTHTFLEKPEILHNSEGKEVLVNQVGWAGLRLGRIDCYFSKSGQIEMAHGGIIEVSKKTI